eukprot:354861-Chlamydomonas_euryale.AAC.11
MERENGPRPRQKLKHDAKGVRPYVWGHTLSAPPRLFCCDATAAIFICQPIGNQPLGIKCIRLSLSSCVRLYYDDKGSEDAESALVCCGDLAGLCLLAWRC